jgi:NAD(P)H-dependent FMN reductase
MKTLLVVFHSPSHNTSLMSDAVAQAAKQYEGVDLKIKIKTPFETDAEDVLHCDAIILGTTENLGYMSGALKDFFDRIYYPCLDVKQGLPVAAIIRAGHDGTGTQRALETILTGLRWRWVQSPLLCKGKWDVKFLTECAELSEGMTLALEQGII